MEQGSWGIYPRRECYARNVDMTGDLSVSPDEAGRATVCDSALTESPLLFMCVSG